MLEQAPAPPCSLPLLAANCPFFVPSCAMEQLPVKSCPALMGCGVIPVMMSLRVWLPWSQGSACSTPQISSGLFSAAELPHQLPPCLLCQGSAGLLQASFRISEMCFKCCVNQGGTSDLGQHWDSLKLVMFVPVLR